MTDSPPDWRAMGRPFLWTALLWLGFCLPLVKAFAPPGSLRPAVEWMIGLWLLSLLDIVALAKAIWVVLELMVAEGEKRNSLLIQASYWAFLKIACVGIFTVVLFRGRTIPTPALLLGVGTLVVVPLAGAYWWDQRFKGH